MHYIICIYHFGMLQACRLASPVNYRNNKGKSIDSVATLSTVLVEPTYLQQISNAIFANAGINKCIELAQGLSPDF